MRTVPRHPFALPPSNGGACGMKDGDRVRYQIDGRYGYADEFMHDGDAFVAFEDGSFETIKWNHLEPAPTPPSNEEGGRDELVG